MSKTIVTLEKGGSAMIEFKPFTRGDWFAFAGAELFPSGAAPLIAELDLDGIMVTAILDGSGAAVIYDLPNDEPCEAWLRTDDIDRARAALEAATCIADLEGLGFQGVLL